MAVTSEQHLTKLVNRLRTAANALEKEGNKEGDKAPSSDVKKGRAAGLRVVAREIESWLT